MTRHPGGRDPQRAGAEVVIVGGGVTGLSAGFWLAREGVDVLVIEAGMIGAEASGRNGGGCSHHHSPLFAEEQRLWPLMDDLLGYPTEFRPERIRLAFSEAQMALYARAKINGEHQGFSTDILDAREAQKLVPLAGDNTVGGYFYHFGGHANPHRTLSGYAFAMEDHGGRAKQNTAVTGFRLAGGRVSGVETTAGFFGCDQLVIAAGPQTGRLAAMIGCDIPLAAARAEMIVTEPLPLMPYGGIDGNGLYGRQTLRGNLAYGGGPHEWIDLDGEGTPRPVNSPVVASLARRLNELFPRLGHVRVIRSWGGIVENTPDGRPILDRLEDPGNVVVASMSSVGFGLSPATGRALSQLVLQGFCDFADLSQLKLSRFGNLPLDWRSRQGWDALPA